MGGVEITSTFLSGRNENESVLVFSHRAERAVLSVVCMSLPLANDHEDLETVLDEQLHVVFAAATHFAACMLLLRCREISCCCSLCPYCCLVVLGFVLNNLTEIFCYSLCLPAYRCDVRRTCTTEILHRVGGSEHGDVAIVAHVSGS